MEKTDRESILAAIDAEGLLERVTGNAVQRIYGNELKLLCPFHDERTPSFHYNIDKGVYQCFGCGAHGDLFDLIGKLKNLPFKDVADGLAKLAGVKTSKHSTVNNGAGVREYYKTCLAKATVAREYLSQRGIDYRVALECQVGYCPKSSDDPLMSGRIIFPLYRLGQGNLSRVGYSGRSIDNSKKRWVHSKGVKTANAFFVCGNVCSGDPILTEGPLDALGLWQSGVSDLTMAYLGSFISDDQAKVLSEHFDEITIWPDFDEAGERGLMKSISSMVACGVRVSVVPDTSIGLSGDDPHKIASRGDASEYLEHKTTVFGDPGSLFKLLISSGMQI